MEKNDKRLTKKEIVKMLLKNNELEEQDEEELLDLLVDQPISIDVDKQEEAKMTKGDRLADKLSEVAGSWGFILGFSAFLLFWILLNTFILRGDNQLDEYPFGLCIEIENKSKSKDPLEVIEYWLNKLDFDINEAYRLSWDDKYKELCRKQNKNIESIVRFNKDMPIISNRFAKK